MTTIQQLQTLWNSHIPSFPLSDVQADLWIYLHNDETLRRGMNATFSKWDRDHAKMDEGYLLRYASKTLNNIKSRTAGEK